MTAKKTLLAALLAALSGALWPLAAAAQLPPEQTSGNVRYLTGGIGQEEVQAMREAAPRFPLALTFTVSTGQYISDVKVTIKGKGGQTVFSAVSGGPMMLVDLAPGPYTVEAAFEGKTLTRKVSLAKGKGQRVVLRWPGPA